MTPSFDDLRFEGDALRVRLGRLLVADQSVGDLVADVRTWQLLCVSVIAGRQPARLRQFVAEVGPVEPLLGASRPNAAWLNRLDQSLVEWLAVTDWMRLLDKRTGELLLVSDRPS